MLDRQGSEIDVTADTIKRRKIGAMRRLMLFRHAKAERSLPGGRDHDRRLTARGRGDAPKLGAHMAAHGLRPDLVIVSTSARTRETWALAGRAFASPPAVTADERIYDAEPETILAVIRKTDP